VAARLRVEPGVWRLVAYAMSLVQLALVMEMVWRRPGVRDEQYKLVGWSLSVAFVVLLLLRIVGAFRCSGWARCCWACSA
jgi:hypothetical protein